MASYIYAVTIKASSPLTEEELLDALDVYAGNSGDDLFKILEFDLEDDEYADA